MFRHVHATPAAAALATIAVTAVLALSAPAAWAGDGGFAAGQDLPAPDPAALGVGDFNNDGRPDLAVTSISRQSVQVLLSQPHGGFTPGPSVPVGRKPDTIAVGDFDGNGNDDLAVGNTLDGIVSIRLGNGDGSFTAARDSVVGQRVHTLVVGDFNGDSIDDLAISTSSSGPAGPIDGIVIRHGQGNGAFTTDYVIPAGAYVLAVGDFNSDTIEDLAFGGTEDGLRPGNLALGAGGGEFRAPTEIALPQQAGFRRGWAVGDFNEDGKTDVISALSNDLVAVRLNRGNGSFDAAPDVPAGAAPGAVAVGDFNSDGHEDFAVTDLRGARVRVRLGDGAGDFASAPDVRVGGSPIDIAVADFDGDGTDDLAVANADGGISVRPGTGPGALTGNLLVNGGFEGPAPSGHVTPVPPIRGWELTGGMTYIRYGSPSHAFFPSWLAAPRFGTGGTRLLWGGSSAGTNGIATASQTVDMSASAQAIDGGRATVSLSAYLGGALNITDAMSVRAEFLDRAGAVGSFSIGPVTWADRQNETTLLRRAGSAPVPAATRQIRVTVTSVDADNSYSSALADNVKLTLTTAPAPTTATTPTTPTTTTSPTTTTAMPRTTTMSTSRLPASFGARTHVSLSVARTPTGRRLLVHVRNGNGFAISGVLRSKRAALSPRAFRVPAATATTLRVVLPAPLRRKLERQGAVRLQVDALVRDPAGHTRAVTADARVRLARPSRR